MKKLVLFLGLCICTMFTACGGGGGGGGGGDNPKVNGVVMPSQVSAVTAK
jgi:hypothetical protein